MRRIPVILKILILVVAGATTVPSQEIDLVRAAGLEGAYMCSVARHAIWPESCFTHTASPIVILVLGDDPHGLQAVLNEAVDKKRITAQGRPFVIRSVASPAELTEAKMDECHMLMITQAATARWGKVAEMLAARPVLTFGESKGFAESGGMIGFVPAEREGSGALGLDMHVNLVAVRKANIQLSTVFLGLLKGVKIVHR